MPSRRIILEQSRLFWNFIAILFFAEQLLKAGIREVFANSDYTRTWFNGIIGIVHVLNSCTAMDALISIILLATLLLLALKFKMRNWAICLLIAGVASNTVDRIVFGGVTDYINVYGNIFNLSDIAIVISSIFLGVRIASEEV